MLYVVCKFDNSMPILLCNYYFHFHGFLFSQVLIITNSEYQ